MKDGKKLKEGAKKLGDNLKNTGKKIGDGAKKIGDKLKDTGKKAKDAFKRSKSEGDKAK